MQLTYYGYNEYVESGGYKLYTAVMLPSKDGKFPTVIKRNPYVNPTTVFSDEKLLMMYMAENEKWLKRGYAVVFQHCRGRGKSEGECEPFINEREDGLNLQDYVRKQNFYKGEIFLWGGSYCCEVHYATAPFADDIKGAVLRVRDTERYSFFYRNGHCKVSLGADWYVTEMYKVRNGITKNYSKNTFNTLLEMGCIPIVNENDAVSTDELTKFGGNDILSAHVANLCRADILINLSDIDGLYDSDPRKNPDAKFIEKVEDIDAILSFAGGAGTDRGTGGMEAKLTAAKMVTENGIPMFIMNGHDPEILYELLDGKHVGTYFVAKK